MLVSLHQRYPNIRKKLLRLFLVNVNPNYISFLALIVAILSGVLFYFGYVVVPSFLALINGFLDILDGEIAKIFGRKSRLGDFIDHTMDRLADISIFLGLTLSPLIPDYLGFATIVVVLFVSYLGTEGQALCRKRVYGGLVGRADRIAIIFLFGLAHPFFQNSMYYGVWLILILSIVTAVQRSFYIYRELS